MREQAKLGKDVGNRLCLNERRTIETHHFISTVTEKNNDNRARMNRGSIPIFSKAVAASRRFSAVIVSFASSFTNPDSSVLNVAFSCDELVSNSPDSLGTNELAVGFISIPDIAP